jgi:hypothetical protein
VTPQNKRERARIIREHAASYSPEVARTLREIADDIEAEAEREEQSMTGSLPSLGPLAS